MLNSIKSLSLAVCLLLISQAAFAQGEKDAAKLIFGDWDVVLEVKGSKLSQKNLKHARKLAKKASGNSNIAIYRFEKGGKFLVSSIQDYSQSDEEGKFTLSEDKKTISRVVKFPKHLKEKKRTKDAKIKAKILYIDESFLVIQSKGKVHYMRKM